MVIYHAKGLTARSQARDLLALAAAEHWGCLPCPKSPGVRAASPISPNMMGGTSTCPTAGTGPCAPWTGPPWGWTSSL